MSDVEVGKNRGYTDSLDVQPVVNETEFSYRSVVSITSDDVRFERVISSIASIYRDRYRTIGDSLSDNEILEVLFPRTDTLQEMKLYLNDDRTTILGISFRGANEEIYVIERFQPLLEKWGETFPISITVSIGGSGKFTRRYFPEGNPNIEPYIEVIRAVNECLTGFELLEGIEQALTVIFRERFGYKPDLDLKIEEYDGNMAIRFCDDRWGERFIRIIQWGLWYMVVWYFSEGDMCGLINVTRSGEDKNLYPFCEALFEYASEPAGEE